MTLPDIRKKIDALDDKLLKLLNERADLVHEVGLIKRNAGLAIYVPEREEHRPGVGRAEDEPAGRVHDDRDRVGFGDGA